jgi:PDZ domain-containing secreted protein
MMEQPGEWEFEGSGNPEHEAPAPKEQISSEMSTDVTPPSRYRRHLPTWVVLTWMLVVLSTTISLAVFSDSGLLLPKGGPVYPVEVSDSTVADPLTVSKGQFLFTTVEYQRVTRGEALLSNIRGESLLPAPQQASSAATSAMAASKRLAIAVAVGKISGNRNTVETHVIASLPGSVAATAGVMMGDRITEISGKEVTDAESVAFALRNPTATEITLKRKSATLKINLPATRPLGLEFATVPVNTLPSLEIKSAGVGGSSAGLMFTLGILDLLTEGDLTGGKIIAGTGTIRANGDVGDVNGIEHKYKSANTSAADIFFTPSPFKYKGSVPVVEIRTLDAALAWLCGNGSSAACELRPEPTRTQP